MATKITTQKFGETHEQEDEVTQYTMTSPTLEVSVIDYGSTITSIKCPDKNGKVDDVVTGFTGVRGYESYPRYFGSTVGRVCNRIAQGKFKLEGKEYSLPINNGPNSLHGGLVGFDKKMWKADILPDHSLVFRMESEDGEEGYPGKLQVSAKYVLNGSELEIHYTATTDKDTIVSLTNHSYFNLAGHDDWKEIYDHQISINADRYTPVDSTSIPTGEIKKVEGTVFDLGKPILLTKERLDSIPGNEAGGYDHNFCLGLDGQRRLAASVIHETSGRTLKVETTQPGIQFYTGNFVQGIPGKHGDTYGKQSCLCLESQNWPDAINRVGTFPNVILRPGEVYEQKTWWTFSTDGK